MVQKNMKVVKWTQITQTQLIWNDQSKMQIKNNVKSDQNKRRPKTNKIKITAIQNKQDRYNDAEQMQRLGIAQDYDHFWCVLFSSINISRWGQSWSNNDIEVVTKTFNDKMLSTNCKKH